MTLEAIREWTLQNSINELNKRREKAWNSLTEQDRYTISRTYAHKINA